MPLNTEQIEQLYCLELEIHGSVQKVSFRDFMADCIASWNACGSNENQVTGFIKNAENKNVVSVKLEGSEITLERILPLFYIGSPKSQIERVKEKKWEKIEKRQFKNFSRKN
ncbi:MAG: acylphosphatase [Patescibacteria group bacterium]|nr:acylphosphatase [Patescibacteria group bacterium]